MTHSQGEQGENSSSSSSSVTAASSESEEDQVCVQQASHSLSLLIECGLYSFLTHSGSGITHLLPGDTVRFLCGRSSLGKYSASKTPVCSSTRLCHVCHHVTQARL